MSKYTAPQAAKLAQQIKERFGQKIALACAGTPVPPKFVAGLIGVEAGRDKFGVISETATRFEPGVFAKLQAVRDGQRASWSGVKTAQIRDATDTALRSLSKSYGLTQIMGWHCINNLDCTVADLRDPEQHLKYTVKLLLLNSKDGDFQRQAYAGEFREWNAGSETGKTYHPDYVYNASAVMESYGQLPDVSVATPEPKPVDPPKPIEIPEPEEKPTVSVQTDPPARIEVKQQGSSIATRIAAISSALTPILGATGLKIGGVEFNTGGLIATAAVIIVGIVVGAILYDRGQQRALEKTKLSAQNLADPNKSNVVIVR